MTKVKIDCYHCANADRDCPYCHNTRSLIVPGVVVHDCDFEFTFEINPFLETCILIEDHRWGEPRGLYMMYESGNVDSIWRTINTLLWYAKAGEGER